MFLLHNCLCLIKIYACSCVTIKQMAVTDHKIKVPFISILILKATDSTQKSKRFCSQPSLHAFKRYVCIYKEQKGHSIEENQQSISSFFSSSSSSRQTCLKNEEICCITNKGKVDKNEWEMTLTFFELYTVYMKKLGQCFFHTYSLTCLNKDISVLLKVINI